MDSETLRKACEEHKKQEGRASFYDVALEIVDDHLLQASIINARAPTCPKLVGIKCRHFRRYRK